MQLIGKQMNLVKNVDYYAFKCTAELFGKKIQYLAVLDLLHANLFLRLIALKTKQ